MTVNSAAASVLAQQAPSGGVPVIAVASIGAALLLAVGILGTWIGLRVIAGANKSKPKHNLETGGNVMIGVVIIAICWGGAIVVAIAGFLGYFTNLDIGTIGG